MKKEDQNDRTHNTSKFIKKKITTRKGTKFKSLRKRNENYKIWKAYPIYDSDKKAEGIKLRHWKIEEEEYLGYERRQESERASEIRVNNRVNHDAFLYIVY